jgi:hypothetical protein
VTVTLTGNGAQHGPMRPDWAPGFADLQCDQCKATWTGPIGEPCGYCAVALENMRRWQADKLLRPELPDPADRQYDAALRAWIERLARGVESDLITSDQARRAATLVRDQRDAA